MDWEEIGKKKIPQSQRQPTLRRSRKPIMQAINFMDDCDASAQRQSSLRHFCGWLVSESGSNEQLTDDPQLANWEIKGDPGDSHGQTDPFEFPRVEKQAVLRAQGFQLTGATSADQGMAPAKHNGGGKGQKGLWERRESSSSDAPRVIKMAAVARRAWMEAMPHRAAVPRALNPKEGGAENGGGPANRNSTAP
ncbi:hypothetical protein N7486_003555 [Penicillium sp. IBT 16267x]|nr:hypothetical protein N7486_003555 [Penicillium sp. IBT 16267x]